MELLFDDECMQKLLPAIESCAKAITEWIAEGRLLCVRFNDDCDGVASALQIYSSARAYALELRLPLENVVGFQVPSAVYSKKDAFDDAVRARDARKNLAVVITDMAANEESVEAIKALKDAGAKVCIIDHHPPCRDALDLCDAYATSHPFDNSGAHTAGLLAYEIGRRICADAARKEWVYWSLQSDKSTLAAGDFPQARALDYLAHFSEPNAGIEDYLEKVSDERTLRLAADLAVKGEEKALKLARDHARIRQTGESAAIILVDLSKARSKAAYPPKGRCLNLMQDYYCAGHPDAAVVSLGYADDSVSIRANALALKRGFDSNRMIEKLKAELSSAIRSGGGHAAASNIRFEPGFEGAVMEKLEELTRQALCGQKAEDAIRPA